MEAYAQARQLGLFEAAQTIVNFMVVPADVLVRIETVKTLADLRAVAAEREALERI